MKEKLKAKLNRGWNWCKENKEILVVVIPVAAAGIGAATKLGSKAINVYKEKNLQDRYCYDRSLGHYWHLKRALSNREWVAIEQRRKNGERLADILNDMRVLK